MSNLAELRQRVWKANLDLVEKGLVVETWGNASGIDRARGLVVIKPSGVPYASLTPEHMVAVALEDGAVVEGKLNPSSDTPTHLVLYRAFKEAGGIVHTHSLQATAWAQARREIPPLGTTHADYFLGSIPCTKELTLEEIQSNYEANTGHSIVAAFSGRDPLSCPAVVVANHAPFTWGQNVEAAVHNAHVLEFVARMAAETLRIFPSVPAMPQVLMEKHFFRKHGSGAYYGQKIGGSDLV